MYSKLLLSSHKRCAFLLLLLLVCVCVCVCVCVVCGVCAFFFVFFHFPFLVVVTAGAGGTVTAPDAFTTLQSVSMMSRARPKYVAEVSNTSLANSYLLIVGVKQHG